MIFTTICVVAFLLQVWQLTQIGRGKLRYGLMIIVYSMYAYIELHIALASPEMRPVLLFGLLNFWAIIQGIRGWAREHTEFR